MCYSNYASFIELLRSFCIHGEACAKILCSEKELLNLKDSKLTQNFYGNKTGFVRLHGSHIRIIVIHYRKVCTLYLAATTDYRQLNNDISN